MIIVEGPDFSGKSTLIHQLANELNLYVIRNRKPRTIQDVMSGIAMAQMHPQTLCDRSALISEPIYGTIIRDNPVITERQAQALLGSLGPFIIVYCDPGKSQVMKCNNDQMEGVKENLERIYDEYAAFMGRVDAPVVVYDFLNPLSYRSLIRVLKDLPSVLPVKSPMPDFESYSVEMFHKKFGVPMPDTPQLLTPDVLEFRLKFLQEELDEFKVDHVNGNLVKAFDALLDLDYVLKGTALMMGISPKQWSQGFDAVQKANMTKMRAPSAEHSKRKSSLDVIKPPGWVGPEETLRKILK